MFLADSLNHQAISQRETPLEDLKLIDCEFSASDLNAILQCPRTLRTLSICSAIDNDDLFDNEEVDHEEFFLAISQSRSGKSLEGFRLDFQHRHYTIVPAPGMDKFLHVKYLEVHPEHLHNKATWHEEYPIPDIDCPIERLLPPNLEVLKITFYDAEEDENIVCDILERKADIVPSLRRIVLTQHYRDREMVEELRKAVAKETDRRNYARANSVISDDFPCHIWRDPMTVLKSHCKREGVELMLLWEDSARKEILREGAGPNLWELSSQIVVSPEPYHAEETARSWRNLYGLE
ncbi:uncharacterized protein PAC_17447 [Phialocephala subalpina]|uniref:Uncharacterized protein n=1 Tax=Phialocephala subalpina TaxID=576137 RepID=A0A1L7XRG8_9HELO|nr:uncharacterized protein PAC_17447 [Phialocephala subalpina]